jgi:hypothetical protein
VHDNQLMGDVNYVLGVRSAAYIDCSGNLLSSEIRAFSNLADIQYAGLL